MIAPYEKVLLTGSPAERLEWNRRVLAQLAAVTDLQKDQFTFLTGARYYQGLLPSLVHIETPLAHLGLGRRLSFLKTHQ